MKSRSENSSEVDGGGSKNSASEVSDTTRDKTRTTEHPAGRLFATLESFVLVAMVFAISSAMRLFILPLLHVLFLVARPAFRALAHISSEIMDVPTPAFLHPHVPRFLIYITSGQIWLAPPLPTIVSAHATGHPLSPNPTIRVLGGGDGDDGDDGGDAGDRLDDHSQDPNLHPADSPTRVPLPSNETSLQLAIVPTLGSQHALRARMLSDLSMTDGRPTSSYLPPGPRTPEFEGSSALSSPTEPGRYERPVQRPVAARNAQIELRRGSLQGSYEDPPWKPSSDDAAVIPAGTESRTDTEENPSTAFEETRMDVWDMVQQVVSHAVSEKALFYSEGEGTRFTLMPSTPSDIPLQRFRRGHGAIPEALAGAPCGSLDPPQLLSILNDILGTDYDLDRPGLRGCLEYVRRASRDFGTVYGTLRPWWRDDFTMTLARLHEREVELEGVRSRAIRDSCIQNSSVPPRRIWDLHSNRVLPLHVVPRDIDSEPKDIPSSVWCVSHSWVEDGEREAVVTKINGEEWPVPIPKSTTLEHVRIELLNMGAEYVWLDVLCLRQRGSPVDESTRMEEWKLDVPTIGYVYSNGTRPCVVYFNGLGLPLDTSDKITQSSRHWFNRVWTLQESLESWVPGGLTGAPLTGAPMFFSRLRTLLGNLQAKNSDYQVMEDLRNRQCTTELDKVAGLTYILGCRAVPLYDETSTTEFAWAMLFKHLDRRRRTIISLLYPADKPFSLWISWAQFLGSRLQHPSHAASIPTSQALKLTDPSLLYSNDYGQYSQIGYAVGPCLIRLSPEVGDDGSRHADFTLADGSNPTPVRLAGTHGILLPTIAYTLLRVGEQRKEYWIAVEIADEDPSRGKTVHRAVKWGVLHTEEDEGSKLVGLGTGRPLQVVYLTTEEASARSKHVKEYMSAFMESRAGNPNSISLARVKLENTPVDFLCEDAPWSSTKTVAPSEITIPQFIEQRASFSTNDHANAEANFMNIWAVARMAQYGAAEPEALFRRSPIQPGRTFTLVPSTRSSVPLQWVHTGTRAIPDTLADSPCAPFTTEALLGELNSVMGTEHGLHMPGLQTCLEHVLSNTRDFGVAYGILRPWWDLDFTTVEQQMTGRRAEDDEIRRNAVDRSCITNSRIPPRRVWDLFSNRVLPFSALPRGKAQRDASKIPQNVWPVSHSWVDRADQGDSPIWTKINGAEWPVTIPNKTTLNHIRIELLNMGAEYVWLDVLCLRMGGLAEKESLRREEWRVDIPTLGYIYSENSGSRRPCVTYFNGLGLPLDTSPTTLQSRRHWLKRVSTLQESSSMWLPGGLTAKPLISTRDKTFYSDVVDLLFRRETYSSISQMLRGRYCTSEHDKVAGLAYLLGCETLPPHYDDIPVESEWALLLKHIDSWVRTILFLRYSADVPFASCVSWKGVSEREPTLTHPLTVTGDSEDLQLVDAEQLYTEDPGQYCHQPYAVGPCTFLQDFANDSPSGAGADMQLQFESTRPSVSFRASAFHGILLAGVPYLLLGIGLQWKEHWVVIEELGTQDVNGKQALQVVKWAVIRVDEGESKRMMSSLFPAGFLGVKVVYVDSEEAQRRGTHVKEYMKKFNESAKKWNSTS